MTGKDVNVAGTPGRPHGKQDGGTLEDACHVRDLTVSMSSQRRIDKSLGCWHAAESRYATESRHVIHTGEFHQQNMCWHP
jgi:hypothetical protein